MAAPTRFAALTEKELDTLLFNTRKGVATILGWRTYHVLYSKGSAPGFPDRVCYRERVLYAELKSNTGIVSPHQEDVLTRLAKAGAECYLLRPADVDEFAKVLGRPWRYDPVTLTLNPDAWRPAALWTPHGCRHDELDAEAA